MRSLLKNNKGILGVGSSMLFLILLVAAVIVISLGLIFFGGSEESTDSSKADEQEASALYQEFKNKLDDNPEYEVEYDLTYSDGDKAKVVFYTKDENTRIEIE